MSDEYGEGIDEAGAMWESKQAAVLLTRQLLYIFSNLQTIIVLL